MKKSLFSLAAISIVMLSGCGTFGHTDVNQTSNTSPIKALPSTIQSKLTPFAKRQRTVHSLPIKERCESKNILYINPGEEYAIQQFISVWPQMKDKPTVVWVNTTEERAKLLWAKEGYNTNPLPSAKTLYTKTNTPAPDAYHSKNSKEWNEMPGVLSSSETNKWISFFE